MGNVANSTAPNTDVNHGPRSGLRHRWACLTPGGGWLSSMRHNRAGKP